MSLLRNALLLASLTVASPAPATVSITLGDALLSRPLAALDLSAATAASETYFDVDALLTLGALALAGGALAAAAFRPSASRKTHAARDMRGKARSLRPRDAA